MNDETSEPVLWLAVAQCAQLVRDARPGDLAESRALTRKLFVARGMDQWESADELMEKVARGGLRRTWRYTLGKRRKRVREKLARLKVIQVSSALAPPRHARSLNISSNQEKLVYPTVQIDLARPMFAAILADLPAVRDSPIRVEGSPEPEQRELLVWLCVDPFSTVRVCVNIGDDVVGFIPNGTCQALEREGVRYLPAFGKSVTVPSILVGSEVESVTLVLRFPLPLPRNLPA